MDTCETVQSIPNNNDPVVIYKGNHQNQITPTANDSNVVYNTIYENIPTLPDQMGSANSFEFQKKIDILMQKVDQMNEKMAKFDVIFPIFVLKQYFRNLSILLIALHVQVISNS